MYHDEGDHVDVDVNMNVNSTVDVVMTIDVMAADRHRARIGAARCLLTTRTGTVRDRRP
jgi:hypothetical protein